MKPAVLLMDDYMLYALDPREQRRSADPGR